ncbi:DKNYY domain-containing protein [Candidatus Gracilibacteria bacterium]|nr:DKNYY domain-containing protein [Candidatus Gracilibacteria bacterium]
MKNKIVSIWSFLVKSHGKEVLLWEWIVYFFCLFLGFWMTYFLAQPESMGGFMNFGNLFHLLFLMVLPIQLIPEFFQEHFSYFFVPDFLEVALVVFVWIASTVFTIVFWLWLPYRFFLIVYKAIAQQSIILAPSLLVWIFCAFAMMQYFHAMNGDRELYLDRSGLIEGNYVLGIILICIASIIVLFSTKKIFQSHNKTKIISLLSIFLFTMIIFELIFHVKDIGGRYAKNHFWVYYRNQEVSGADPSTFTLLHEPFKSHPAIAKDKNSFYVGAKATQSFDSESMEVLVGDYYRDKNNVYFRHNVIGGADPVTFEVLQDKGYDSYRYAKDNIFVYKNGNVLGYIDAQSFELIHPYYSYYTKDKNNVFYHDEVLIGADPKSFVYLDGGYAYDANNLYLQGKQIENIQSATLKDLGNGYIAVDNKIYSHNGEWITVADMESYEVIDQNYTKDEHNVYLTPAYEDNIIIQEADPKTFQILTKYYTKDQNSVYHLGKLIEKADPLSFELLSENHTKDKNNVFHYNNIIFGADSKTFKILNPSLSYAKDKNFFYNEGKRVYNRSFIISESRKINISPDPYLENILKTPKEFQYFDLLDWIKWHQKNDEVSSHHETCYIEAIAEKAQRFVLNSQYDILQLDCGVSIGNYRVFLYYLIDQDHQPQLLTFPHYWGGEKIPQTTLIPAVFNPDTKKIEGHVRNQYTDETNKKVIVDSDFYYAWSEYTNSFKFYKDIE